MRRLSAIAVPAIFITLTMAGLLVSGQATGRLPSFDDYRVDQVYTGPIATPILKTPEERLYKTALQEGIRTGFGVGEGPQLISKPEPTFAGRYVVVHWGCGSDCRMMGLIDAKTGTVYPPPLGGKGNRYFEVPFAPVDHNAFVDFRVNSRLMIVRHACPDPTSCGDYYLVFESEKFKLLHMQSLKLKTWSSR